MHLPPTGQPAPAKYHLPEKDRQAILQNSDYFKQSQEIEAQRQRFMQLNNCDQWGEKNDR